MTHNSQHSDIYNRAAQWWGDLLLPDAPDAMRAQFTTCLADIMVQNIRKTGSGNGALCVSGSGVSGLVLALGARPDPLLASALRAADAPFPPPRPDDPVDMWFDGDAIWVCSGYRAPPRPL